MSLVKVYSKTAVDLTAKVGAYAYFMTDLVGGHLKKAKPFIKAIKTMVHADCMGAVNALHILSNLEVSETLEHLEVITDSSKVIALLETGKADKYCDESLNHWLQVVKPKFPKLQSIKFTHVNRKGTGPADNVRMLVHLEEIADQELNKSKMLAH